MRLLASCCAAAYSCAFLPSLRFIGEQQLAHQLQYKDSTVGGLSGIDYDVDTDTCILLSDERSRHNAARFYTATLDYDETSFNRVILNDVVYFIQQNQASSPEQANEIVDLEDIRFDPLDGSIWYVSEGDRRLGLNPFIRQATRQGEFISELALHLMFSMYTDCELGPRDNLSFEGLSFSQNKQSLWVAMEGSLFQDGEVPTPTAKTMLQNKIAMASESSE